MVFLAKIGASPFLQRRGGIQGVTQFLNGELLNFRALPPIRNQTVLAAPPFSVFPHPLSSVASQLSRVLALHFHRSDLCNRHTWLIILISGLIGLLAIA